MAVKQIHGLAKWKKFSRDFSAELASCNEELTNFGAMILRESCRDWLDKTDSEWPSGTVTMPNGAKFGGDREHPWYTGQLHDSIAVRISDKNKTVAIEYMHASANKPQTAFGSEVGGNYSNIIGAEWAMKEAAKARYVFLGGVQAQLIVGVPYADKVNKSARHYMFIENLQSQFEDHLIRRINEATEDGAFRTRVFRPRKK